MNERDKNKYLYKVYQHQYKVMVDMIQICVITNDTVDIILNCQLGLISLFNHRTRKKYEIQVDLKKGCPLPWQLHINLYGPDDRVKIINPP